MDTLWQDVRLALRLVRRSPGFSATVILTLALGIGANAAVFGVINGLLLRPLPVADPHRLVTISSDAAIAHGYPRSRDGDVQRTVVGIVDDAVFESQREGIQPMVFLPMAQAVGNGPDGPTEISVGVRPAVGSPMQLARSVGTAVTGVDAGLAFTFRLLTDHVDASVRQERIVAVLSGLFGALALLIAALGLYGVTSYMVNRRFNEIGIRMALGAQRADVLGLILRQTLALTAIGIGVGLAGASAVTRYLRGMLFGLTPLDPGTFIGVAVLFAVVAAVAAFIPAHRATKVDPLVALRTD